MKEAVLGASREEGWREGYPGPRSTEATGGRGCPGPKDGQNFQPQGQARKDLARGLKG